MTKKNVLIAGATGYLGVQLIKILNTLTKPKNILYPNFLIQIFSWNPDVFFTYCESLTIKILQ